MLHKRAGFTAVAVLSLAIGIGLCSANFATLNAGMLRPLPGVADPTGLVSLQRPVPYPFFETYRDEGDVAMAAAGARDLLNQYVPAPPVCQRLTLTVGDDARSRYLKDKCRPRKDSSTKGDFPGPYDRPLSTVARSGRVLLLNSKTQEVL